MTISHHLKTLLAGGAMAMALTVTAPTAAKAQDTPFIGQLAAFGFNFCPRGWAPANGSLLAISQYNALFALLGTQFGGNGQTTFGLPDLRGRAAIGFGSGNGLTNYPMGAKGGTESVTLTVPQMPSHSHTMNTTNEAADKHGPGTDFLAAPYNADGSELNIYHEGPPNRQMDPGAISPTGGGQAHENRMPFQAVNWCIATEGIFPPRN